MRDFIVLVAAFSASGQNVHAPTLSVVIQILLSVRAKRITTVRGIAMRAAHARHRAATRQ